MNTGNRDKPEYLCNLARATLFADSIPAGYSHFVYCGKSPTSFMDMAAYFLNNCHMFFY